MNIKAVALITLAAMSIPLAGCASSRETPAQNAEPRAQAPASPPPITGPRMGWYENKDMEKNGGPFDNQDQWWEYCDGHDLVRYHINYLRNRESQSTIPNHIKCT